MPISCPVEHPSDIAALGADTMVVGPAIDPAGPVGDVIVCRIRPSGDAAWSASIPDASVLDPISVSVGGSIDVAVTKQREPSLVPYGFVRRFGADGTAQQSVEIDSGSGVTVNDIVVGPDGHVTVTGATKGLLAAIPPSTNASHTDAFVRSFDASLNVLWTDQFRGTISSQYNPAPTDGYAWGTALAADPSGIYVVGTVAGALPGGPAMRWQEDTFIRRYESSGIVGWTRQIDATWPDAVDDFHSELQTHPTDVAVGPQGVDVVGESAWLGDRDPGRRYDAFERAYARDGSVIWTHEIGGWNDDTALKVVTDPTGSVMLGRAVEGLGDPGGPASMFLARFGPTGESAAVVELVPAGSWFTSATIAGDGSLVRLASVVVPNPSIDPPATDVFPPTGTNLVRFDLAAPSVSVPVVTPVRGWAATPTTIPIDIRWTATDGGTAVTDSDVQVSRNGGPWQDLAVSAPATRLIRTTAPLTGTIRVRVRATDGAQNVSAWTYGPAITLAVVQETAAAVHESASWVRTVQFTALGGYVDKTQTRGAWARYTFLGRAIVWVGPVAPTRGQADVYLDGKFVTRIDARAAAGATSQLLFQHTWSAVGTHTIELRNRATTGRPRIDLDAFVVLR